MVPCRVLLADPPWKNRDQLPGDRGASYKYTTMSTRDIMAIQLPPMDEDAVLFLWRLASMVRDALDVVRAWGFEDKSEFVWVKTGGDVVIPQEVEFEPPQPPSLGLGHYTRLEHEVCMIATRGRGASLITDHGVRSVIYAPRGIHSRKPDASYELIERLTAGVSPRIEIFATVERDGWDCYGLALGREIPPALFGGLW